MKKFFALMLVVAMLSVAGIASATSLTANSTSVTVERGQSATVTLTGTASHNGTLAYTILYGPSWATVSGSGTSGTLTLAPASTLSATNTSVTVQVTETFSGPEAGHAGSATETANVTIAVSVTAPIDAGDKVDGGGSKAAETTTETVTKVVTQTVTAVKVIRIDVAAIVTPAQVVTRSAQQTVVVNTVSTLAQALRAIFAPIPVTGDVLVNDNNNITVVESVNYDPSGSAAANEENLRRAAARLKQKIGNNTKRAIGVVPPIKAAQSGLQPFDLPKFDKAFYNKKPGLDMGKRTSVTAGSYSFFASATDGGNEAIFLDSTGTQVEVVPDGTGSGDAGVLTAVAYVEAGAEYEPIITTEVTAAEEASFDADTGSQTVASVDVAETKVETVTVNSTATFSPVVDDVVVASISSLYGKSLDTLPTRTASTTTTWAASDAERSYMAANNLIYVCALPVLENVPDGAYVAKIVFDTTPPASADKVGIPAFYPAGVAEGGAAKAVVYTESEGNFTAISDGSVIKNGLAAYLVFEVANGAVVAASEFEAAAVTISKPALVVEATESGHEPTPTPVTSGDQVLDALKARGFVNASGTILDAGFAKKPAFNATTTSAEVELNFDVVSWEITVQGYSGIVKTVAASDVASITGQTSRKATITLTPSEIAQRDTGRTVTLSVLPTVSGDRAKTSVKRDVGTVFGTKSGSAPLDYGVGSSSGGCSAGSAVLALAVLGAFIAARKK